MYFILNPVRFIKSSPDTVSSKRVNNALFFYFSCVFVSFPPPFHAVRKMNSMLATNLLTLSVFVSFFQGISSTTGIFNSSDVETAVTMGGSSKNVQTTSVVAEGTISPDVSTPAPSTETQTITMQESTSRTVVPVTTSSSSVQGSNPSFETIVVMETTTIVAADTSVNGATTSPAVVSSRSVVMDGSAVMISSSAVVSSSSAVISGSAVSSSETTSGAIQPTVLPSPLSGSITTNNLTEAFTGIFICYASNNNNNNKLNNDNDNCIL